MNINQESLVCIKPAARISELIAHLEAVKATHGDIVCGLHDPRGQVTHPLDVTRAAVLELASIDDNRYGLPVWYVAKDTDLRLFHPECSAGGPHPVLVFN